MRTALVSQKAALLLLAVVVPLSAATPPATQPDPLADRLTFLTLQLSSVEASLASTNVALRAAGYKTTIESDKATQAAKGNEYMDRNGGAPIAWDKFYGQTADQFAPRDIGGIPHNYRRPPQFDYLYKANNAQIAKAQDEVAALGKKIDVLLAHRRKLEGEQSSLWATIAWESLQNREIAVNPLYRLKLIPTGAPTPATDARREILRPAVLFLRTVDRIVADDLDSLPINQPATLQDLKDRTEAAYAALREPFANALLAKDLAPDDLKTAHDLLTVMKALPVLSKNSADAYRLALDADAGNDDARKLTSRGQLQSALLAYSTAGADLDNRLAALATTWEFQGQPGTPTSDAVPLRAIRITAAPSDAPATPGSSTPASAPTAPIAASTDAPASARTVNLLALIDPAQDAIGGTWILNAGQLSCTASNDNEIQFPYLPGPDYDLRLSFQISSGGKGINIIGLTSRGPFAWGYGINSRFFGIRDVNGHDVNDSHNPTSGSGILKHRVPYTMVLKVRGSIVDAFLDQNPISHLDTASNKVGIPKEYLVPGKTFLGLNTKGCDVIISAAEVIDLTGQGKIIHQH